MTNMYLFILVVSGVLCGALGEEQPCENVDCGLDFECFHKLNPELNIVEAICIPIHSQLREVDDGDQVGDQTKYKKVCPQMTKYCGPNYFQNLCTKDLECDDVNKMCCFDGCKQVCQKFKMSAHDILG